jgi:HD-like signal output (HDOD) protein
MKAIPASMQGWVEMLRYAELPVLAHTVSELQNLQKDDDRATPKNVSKAVMHDPMMTVRVLQYLQCHRSVRRSTEITTIAHALMMLGLSPFFEHFGVQAAIEDNLAEDPAALRGTRAVISRARHAALYAYDWANLRHDIDPEEVMVAALLHDMAEILLWCFAPSLALEIAARQQQDRTLRSDKAQLGVLGFRLIDLQLAMVKAWHLPYLLRELIDERYAHSPRVTNVTVAAAVARHSAHGWDDAALPDDYTAIGRLLGLNSAEAYKRVVNVTLRAAADDEWYGVPSPAALLPAPEPAPDAETGEVAGDAIAAGASAPAQ